MSYSIQNTNAKESKILALVTLHPRMTSRPVENNLPLNKSVMISLFILGNTPCKNVNSSLKENSLPYHLP